MFGQTLFGGSRFVFWTITPSVVVTLLVLNTMQLEWTPTQTTLVGAIDVGALSLMVGLYDPVRFRWACRFVSGEVFLAYLAYLVHEWVFSPHPLRLLEPRSTASPRNALLGFVVIGIPSLLFALTGSFGATHHDDELTDQDDEEPASMERRG